MEWEEVFPAILCRAGENHPKTNLNVKVSPSLAYTSPNHFHHKFITCSLPQQRQFSTAQIKESVKETVSRGK